MKRFLQWITDRISCLMDGRYGCDGLSVFYLCLSVVTAGCGSILPDGTMRKVLYAAASILAVYAIYRCFSRDKSKQKAQWDSFRSEIDEINYKISLHAGVWKIRRGYRYVNCKQCGFRYRVIRKKGKHTVTCPNCGNLQIIKH